MTPRARFTLLCTLTGIGTGWLLRQVTVQYGWSPVLILTFVCGWGFLLGGFDSYLRNQRIIEDLETELEIERDEHAQVRQQIEKIQNVGRHPALRRLQ